MLPCRVGSKLLGIIPPGPGGCNKSFAKLIDCYQWSGAGNLLRRIQVPFEASGRLVSVHLDTGVPWTAAKVKERAKCNMNETIDFKSEIVVPVRASFASVVLVVEDVVMAVTLDE